MLGGLLLLVIGISAQVNSYGGWEGLQVEATGYFRVEKIDEVWWIIDPSGKAFISKGVNHVAYKGDNAPKLGTAPYNDIVTKKYSSHEAWAEAIVQRLKGWNFNTIGSWSDEQTYTHGMAYTSILGIGARAGGDWQRGAFPDVFSERFREAADKVAEERCTPRRDDPLLLGYFTDNELKWGPDWRSEKGLFADFWELPHDAPGRIVAVNFIKSYYDGSIERFNKAWEAQYADWDALQKTTSLRDIGPHVKASQDNLRHNRLLGMVPKTLALVYLKVNYGTVEAFNKEWGSRFQSLEEVVTKCSISPFGEELNSVEAVFSGRVAEQYFKICGEAIRKYDPNHLILGCRFAGYAPEEVVAGIGEYVDIVSYNNYDFLPPVEKLRQIHELTGRPMMLTEFSFKAMDSGLPNTRGAGTPVATQQDRADHFDRYVTALMKLPHMVGFHWFEHADEPAEGRFDGENSNYGVVNIKDEPWEVLTSRMREVNAGLENIHQASGKGGK